MRRIELLSPARDPETGIAAVNHGADAVYIGASRFGARSGASNSITDIEKLIRHAHLYNSRVYAAVNTILFENELEEARRLIIDLHDAGIDAVIIQDMGITEMDLPPVPFHASTQTDCYDPERVRFLDRAGFKRIVLARELSIEKIRTIRSEVSAELEVFIHGALCVSLSGRCYMSAASGGRSANRGECAQPCRKSYTLTDSRGEIISRRGFPLSLRDMNRSTNIGELIDAGIDSFKIEGRLKDAAYVKNITLHYRKIIDSILEGKKNFTPASSGRVYPGFTPDPERSFNRNFTEYFIHGRGADISSPYTPKSLGEKLGTVTMIREDWFSIRTGKKISNGDGLAFFSRDNILTGLRVNRADEDRVFPLDMKGLYAGAIIYRNHGVEFEKLLAREKTERKIGVEMKLSETETGFRLSVTDSDGNSVTSDIESVKEKPKSGSSPNERIISQLSKLGGTIFTADQIYLKFDAPYHIPVSTINGLRRDAVQNLISLRLECYRLLRIPFEKNSEPYPLKKISFTHNVSNSLAGEFYRRHGVEEIEKSFETSEKKIGGPLMTTKLCLRYENSLCPKQNGAESRFREPFYLTDGEKKFRVEFDCAGCLMLIYRDSD